MARAGKLTIFVDETRNNTHISVRTVGATGDKRLNTVSLDFDLGHRVGAPTADAYWQAVLAAVSPLV